MVAGPTQLDRAPASARSDISTSNCEQLRAQTALPAGLFHVALTADARPCRARVMLRSACSVLLLLGAAAQTPASASAAPATSGGPWSAGWWATAAGGLPAQPSNLQSYFLNRSVVGYFVANNTGLASAEELTADTKLGVVGIGWNLYHSATSKTGGIEGYEVQQAAALKKARPEVGVMVLRNTEVVSICSGEHTINSFKLPLFFGLILWRIFPE